MIDKSNDQRLKKAAWRLKLAGLAILATGLILVLMDLLGYLHYEKRQAFLDWALQSQTGLPMGDEAPNPREPSSSS